MTAKVMLSWTPLFFFITWSESSKLNGYITPGDFMGTSRLGTIQYTLFWALREEKYRCYITHGPHVWTFYMKSPYFLKKIFLHSLYVPIADNL